MWGHLVLIYEYKMSPPHSSSVETKSGWYLDQSFNLGPATTSNLLCYTLLTLFVAKKIFKMSWFMLRVKNSQYNCLILGSKLTLPQENFNCVFSFNVYWQNVSGIWIGQNMSGIWIWQNVSRIWIWQNMSQSRCNIDLPPSWSPNSNIKIFVEYLFNRPIQKTQQGVC